MKKLKVMLVDDDRDFAESLAEVLEDRGHDVTVVLGGQQAVQMCRQRYFDIILMDVKMPGMNGVEAFIEIRKVRPHARVLMLTGFSVDQLLDRAVERGAMGVLHKPLNMDRLLALLQNVDPDGVILVADDDPDFVATVQELLECRGYTVIIARTGQEAIDRALTEDIDILLLDLRLPVLSGVEVCRALQGRGRLPQTIAVTAYRAEEAEQVKALKFMEVMECLFKPFDPEQLLRAIEASRPGA